MKNVAREVVLSGLAVVLLAAAGLTYYQNGRSTTPATKPAAGSQTPQPTQSAEEKAQEDLNAQVTTADVPKGSPVAQTSIKLKIYFSHHTESDDDPSKIFGVVRTANTVGVGTYAIQQLIAGPTTEELALNYFSNVKLSGASNCGDKDFALNITNKVATLRFCKQFVLTGVVADGQAQSQIMTTLSQFSTIKKIVILNQSGNCLFDASGLNKCKE